MEPKIINLHDANGLPFGTMDSNAVNLLDGEGHIDMGALHRAIAIVRDLRRLGHWDGKAPIRVADAYAIYNSLDQYVTVALEEEYGELVVRRAEVEVRKDHFGDFQPEIVQPEPLPFDGPVQDEPDPNIDVQTFTAEELIEAKNIEIARLIDELAKAQSQLQSLVKPLRVVNLTEISPLEGLTLLHELKRVALLHEAKRAAKVGE